MRSPIRRGLGVSLATVAILLALATATSAATPLTVERVASGLARPVFVTSPPGDVHRVFVVEQRSGSTGRVRIIKDGALLATPFLSVPSVSTGSEQGLLGLAFAPDYQTSGTFYIYYTDSGGTSQLARYTVSADPDVANPTGAVILSVTQPFSNHNGGWLAFGPDGYLYLSLGDGGSGGDPANRAQNTNDLLGKLLRLDVTGQATYASPSGNPYVGVAGRDEIWSLGLRNAWRGGFDRETGDLYIADVGQNIWEEVNFHSATEGAGRGVNFGWRCWEGNHSYTSSTVTPCGSCDSLSCFVFPVHEYNHTSGRCSITGGTVYRGLAVPDLAGTYFFADYCSGEVFSFKMAGGAAVDLTDRTAELKPSDAPSLGNISSFGEDAFGELYICDIGGSVYKIVPAEQTAVRPGPRPEPLLRLAGPSPFHDTLHLALRLPEPGAVRVDVFDLAGRRVRALADETLAAGEHPLSWNGRTDAGRRAKAGFYFIRIATPFGTEAVKTVYLQ
jgi:glucose/arabinose dehydrogenase